MKISKNEFADRIVELINTKVKNIVVGKKTIPKNNMDVLVWAFLCSEQEKVSMYTLAYVEDYYNKYVNGDADLEDIVEELIDKFYTRRNTHEKCVNDVYEKLKQGFNVWKNKLYVKIVNTDKNKKQLNQLVHEDYLDLSLVAYIKVEEETSINFSVSLATAWQVSQEKVLKVAKENTFRADNIRLQSIDSLIGISESIDPFPMWMVTNKEGVWGASMMANSDLLKEIGNILKSNFWLLPASVHEVIIVATNCSDYTADFLRNIVCDVNQEIVEKNDFLSNSVYFYDTIKEKLTIKEGVEKDE